MELNIAVCMKPVPDPNCYDRIVIDPETKTLVRQGIPMTVNPDDRNALEEALRLKEEHGGRISVFSMAPPDAEEILREALATGADEAYLLSDRGFAGADTLATSYTLHLGIKRAGRFDLVLMGNQSADGATAQVPSQLGEWLKIPHLVNVEHLRIDDQHSVTASMKTENGYIKYKTTLPAVIAVRRQINRPRYVSLRSLMSARQKKIHAWGVKDLNPDVTKIGLKGSPTQPGELYIPDIRRKGERLTGHPEEIVEKLIAVLRAAGVTIGEMS